MLRCVLRAATVSPRLYSNLPATVIPATTAINNGAASSKFSYAEYSSKITRSNLSKAKKAKSKSDEKSDEPAAGGDDSDSFEFAEEERARRLAEDEKDNSLNVGHNGRPLFTSATSIAQLTRKDTCTYMKFSVENLEAVLPEGLPLGMVKEFEESSRSALLIRQSFLDLRDNFRRIFDPPLPPYVAKGPKVQKQIVLDGPVSCGKSIALAMLVHWARDEGWLVLYVPNGRKWTHGGSFYKNPLTGLWDTPVQAAEILQARLYPFY